MSRVIRVLVYVSLMMMGFVRCQRFLLAPQRSVRTSLALVIIATGLIGCSSSSRNTGSGMVTVTSTAGSLSKTTTINFDVK